jgi:hypothetical protein
MLRHQSVLDSGSAAAIMRWYTAASMKVTAGNALEREDDGDGR